MKIISIRARLLSTARILPVAVFIFGLGGCKEIKFVSPYDYGYGRAQRDFDEGKKYKSYSDIPGYNKDRNLAYKRGYVRGLRDSTLGKGNTIKPPNPPMKIFIIEDGASCFTAGTTVLMADGGTKMIEDVRIGEKVLGKDGALSTVTGIERPRLGKRLLYAINGGRAFVTAEHPFWTASGWKSIDPRATFAENPRLTVGALEVGDLVAMLAEPKLAAAGGGAVTISYAPAASLQSQAIRSILGVTGDPRMRVYNLLLGGNHTYFADGFLVHNKG